MTREEAIEILRRELPDFEDKDKDIARIFPEVVIALDMAIKALEQQPCETIKEIPKDYKYDTETEDFLVYRHMYTGHEIHIEKPVPRYRLEQQPCGDCISRQAAKDALMELLDRPNHAEFLYTDEICRALNHLPSVEPERKKGKWGYCYGDKFRVFECSECGRTETCLYYRNVKVDYPYCHCGAKMEVDNGLDK